MRTCSYAYCTVRGSTPFCFAPGPNYCVKQGMLHTNLTVFLCFAQKLSQKKNFPVAYFIGTLAGLAPLAIF